MFAGTEQDLASSLSDLASRFSVSTSMSQAFLYCLFTADNSPVGISEEDSSSSSDSSSSEEEDEVDVGSCVRRRSLGKEKQN